MSRDGMEFYECRHCGDDCPDDLGFVLDDVDNTCICPDCWESNGD